MKERVSKLALPSLLLLLALPGCKDGDSGEVTGTRLRLLHASPDLPEVDVVVVGIPSELFSSVEYGEATGFRGILPGTYTVVLRAAALGPLSPALATSQPFEVAENASVTLVAAGLLLAQQPEEALRLEVFPDAFAPAAGSAARVRFVHAVSGAGPLQLDLNGDGSADTIAVDRFQATAPEGFDLAAGTPVTLGVLAGSPPARVAGFEVPALDQGQDYYLVATGVGALEELRGPALLVAGSGGTVQFAAQAPRAYVLNVSPDAAELDLFAGDQELADGLGFGELAGPVPLAAGGAVLDLFPSQAGAARPGTAPAASANLGELESGKTYLLLVSGYFASGRSPALTVAAVAEEFRVFNPLLARLRGVNASPDTPTAALVAKTEAGRLLPIPDLTALSYLRPSSAEGAVLPPQELTLGLLSIGQREANTEFEIDLTSRPRAFGVVAGLSSPSGSEPPLQLILVDTSASPWTATSTADQPAPVPP